MAITTRRVRASALVALGLFAFSATPAHAADGWTKVGAGITGGISGFALIDRESALVVRDNKKSGENRVARLSFRAGGTPSLKPLTWRGETPTDLEAAAAVPGRAGEYLALASSGRVYHVKLAGDRVSVLRAFTVPKGQSGDNYEGLALVSRGGGLVAAWADRGQDARPATVYTATLDLAKGRFGPVRSVAYRTSYPVSDVRHSSDLSIDEAGGVLVSTASDPGDDGPFDSAVFRIGTLRDENGPAVVLAATATQVTVQRGHKIEAMTCLDGGCTRLLLGTDDENAGGAVRIV
ncbi:hypothetical protein JOF53_003995 [Crossiella equi]|uniref:Uncharacterized protein n=1 Tax=Crossiella equi TaxID=130796 RepID=A0ABS5AEW2_9PSEU|nr:esterase-like activity of phytase family protein [Crossiella equi]MBP2475123.1 hypothetical protein [Crossiella equi]